MHVIGSDLFDGDGKKVATFSGHWPACAAMIVHGKPLDETKWPIRCGGMFGVGEMRKDDLDIIRSLQCAYSAQTCPICGGSGKEYDETCLTCFGDGEVEY